MEDTRESLTEKVSLLEQQVVEKIQSATDAVHETVQSVRDTVACVSDSVKNSVESVSEGVKEMFDVKARTREAPWLMVGGAAVAGLVTGMIVFRRPRPSATTLPAYTPMPAAAFTPPREQPTRPSWVNDLFDLAGREV